MTMATMTASWSDGKRYWWLLSPALPLLVLAGLIIITSTAIFSGHGARRSSSTSWWPFLDLMIGADRTNPPDSAIADLERDRYYRWIVYAYIPIQYGVTIYGAWLAMRHTTGWIAYVGLIFSVGMINGIGINTAHELGHKRENMERWLSRITLAPVAYGHFFVEHNRGHHRNVATPEDPASSRMGESFWGVPAAHHGRFAALGMGAWERERLSRARPRPLALAKRKSSGVGDDGCGVSARLRSGSAGRCCRSSSLQAFYGASLLGVVNYIEHYGLLRRKDANGRYARCEPEHSWNNNHIMSNVFLYQLQRHSDHHANPMRRFQALRHFDNSPQLPVGYAGMLLPAYIPVWWYRLMDKRVIAHYRAISPGRICSPPPAARRSWRGIRTRLAAE